MREPADVPRGRARAWAWGMRLGGLVLLGILLARLDLRAVGDALTGAAPWLVALAVAGIPPLILVKTLRWRGILASQSIRYPLGPAFLAYMGSLFVGFLTPGRLGEFVKATHVSRDCCVSGPRAFSSVLTDRLFDLYALVLVAGPMVAGRVAGRDMRWQVAALALVLVGPLAILLPRRPYDLLERFARRLGGVKVGRADGWLGEIRSGLLGLGVQGLATGTALTLAGYTLFFGQCFLLARALGMTIGFATVVEAVGLGSLVTLLPISISGLGTREATVVAYLGGLGVSPEVAVSFSLLVFMVFYVVGGAMGALAWLAKPVPSPAGAMPSGPERR